MRKVKLDHDSFHVMSICAEQYILCNFEASKVHGGQKYCPLPILQGGQFVLDCVYRANTIVAHQFFAGGKRSYVKLCTGVDKILED